MLFSGKENIFKCLVAFQKILWKIFSGVWLCCWKYHRKHIFYLLLTFSQLPNKYIISFLNPETQTKPRKKKIHNPAATGFDDRRDHAKPIGAAIAIGVKARSWSRTTIWVEDDRFWGATRSGTTIWVGLFWVFWVLPLSLSLFAWAHLPLTQLSLCFSKILWSENESIKSFPGQRSKFLVKWKWFLENSIFKTNQIAYFTENDFLKPFSPKTNIA